MMQKNLVWTRRSLHVFLKDMVHTKRCCLAIQCNVAHLDRIFTILWHLFSNTNTLLHWCSPIRSDIARPKGVQYHPVLEKLFKFAHCKLNNWDPRYGKSKGGRLPRESEHPLSARTIFNGSVLHVSHFEGNSAVTAQCLYNSWHENHEANPLCPPKQFWLKCHLSNHLQVGGTQVPVTISAHIFTTFYDPVISSFLQLFLFWLF